MPTPEPGGDGMFQKRKKKKKNVQTAFLRESRQFHSGSARGTPFFFFFENVQYKQFPHISSQLQQFSCCDIHQDGLTEKKKTWRI